jgi:hypothetical protein
MEISIHSLLEGAKRATGSVAVIDVFRAFTTAAVALGERGIEYRDGSLGRGGDGATRRRNWPDLYGQGSRSSTTRLRLC